ncbi:MAG: Na+/H+ antiporter subunit D [Actinobacteria bacterium]|nr:Na+/H+ antiporter subunit D [Actinomycetota bacterium]
MLIAIPILVPLAAAGVSVMLLRRPLAQRSLSVVSLSVVLAATARLLAQVRVEGTSVLQVGAWPAPFGITLVADPLAAIMLTVSAVVLLVVLLYAIGHPTTRDETRAFHAVYLVLAAGVSASFLAGDLFNLFVAFEVMLISSYVLITLGGTLAQVRSGMTYMVISLLASTLFIATVGIVYASTGTVNLADLVDRVGGLPPGLRTGVGLLLLIVFGVKAAIFPLFMWLPDAYPTAAAPITAVFAGLLTKVGVYAMIRTQTLLFVDLGTPSPLLLVIAGATMVVGVLGAIAQDDIKRILSFQIISQIGYMVMGLGLLTVAGLAGGIFYIVHSILVKTGLFLVGGMVEQRTGTAALRDLGGLGQRTAVTAVLFAALALSLAGFPPLSGFVAKLSLVQAGLDVDQGAIVAVSLAVSVLTLFSMSKVWNSAFWGQAPEATDHQDVPRSMTATTVAVVVATVAVAVSAGPLVDLSVEAAHALEPARYVEAVLPR